VNETQKFTSGAVIIFQMGYSCLYLLTGELCWLFRKLLKARLHGSPRLFNAVESNWIQRLNDFVYTVPQKWTRQLISKWRQMNFAGRCCC